ncbi:MAG: hypothetical protein ACRC32_03505 [Chroococcidiopsis sp.]
MTIRTNQHGLIQLRFNAIERRSESRDRKLFPRRIKMMELQRC